MSLLELLAGIPINANLKLQLEAFAKKSVSLESENLILKQENFDLKNQIASLKKPKAAFSAPVKRVG